VSEATHDAEQEQFRKEIAELKQSVAATEQARVTAEKQRDDTEVKFAEASNHIAGLERERDEALSQLKSARETEQHLQLLVAEKNDVQQKLATAEEKIRQVNDTDPQSAKKLA
jgi:chromosome segregation ATPase